MSTLELMCAARLIPVVVLDELADAGPLAAALVAGGLPVAEVTFRTPVAVDAIRVMAARGDLLVGAGTVLTADQVDQAVAAGAEFVVSPGLSRAVVERCREHGVSRAARCRHGDRDPGGPRDGHLHREVLPGRGLWRWPAAVAALAAPFGG